MTILMRRAAGPYSKGREINRERQRRYCTFPNAHSSQDWVRLKSGAGNSIQVSHRGGRTQVLETPPAVSLSAHGQEAESEAMLGLETGTPICDAGIPSSILTTASTTKL